MENQGVTSAKLAELRDKKVIMENIMWKPDGIGGGKRTFFPYLSGDFVKRRLIEVLGSENLQFMLEKDEEFYAKGSLGIFLADRQDWNFYSAIGVEKEGKNLSGEKLHKVKFKGNVTDTMKSCAGWLGLMVPAGVEPKRVIEKDKKYYTDQNKLIGTIYDKEKINSYLNSISHTRHLIAQIWSLNKATFESNERLTADLQSLLKALDNG